MSAEYQDRIWVIGQVAFKHPRNGGAEYVRVRTTPSDAAIRAAEEIDDLFDIALQGGRLYAEGFNRAEVKKRVAAIITRHLAGTADAPETVELQIARRFLVKMGYARCASAACGCNSWHERRP